MGTRTRTAALAATLITVIAPVANAAERHAVATGGATSGDCIATPCQLKYVLENPNGSAAGDTVILAPGTYVIPNNEGIATTRPLDIRGTDGQPRPVIKSDALGGGFPFQIGFGSDGAKLTHIAFEMNGFAVVVRASTTISDARFTSNGACLSFQEGTSSLTDSEFHRFDGPGGGPCLGTFEPGDVTVRDVSVVDEETEVFSQAVLLGGKKTVAEDIQVTSAGNGVVLQPNSLFPITPMDAVLRRLSITAQRTALTTWQGTLTTDSLARSTGPDGNAVALRNGGTLRNVTAVATGSNGSGVRVPASRSDEGIGLTATAANVIARGAGNDVVVEPDGPVNEPGCIPNPPGWCDQHQLALTITNSDFHTLSGTLDPASANNTDLGDQFVDAAADNFRLKPGSPLIDAGADNAGNGPTDLDGRARKIGTAPDVGAFEFDPPPVVTPPVDTTPVDTGSGGGGQQQGNAQTPGGGGAQTPGDSTTPGGQGDGNPAPAGTGPVADVLAPGVTALSLTNRTFAVGSGATPVNARAKSGTTFRYTLTEAARVTITIERASPGRRSGKRCVKPTRKNAKKKRCTRYTKAGTLTRAGKAGQNSVPFSGRIGKKKLSVGKYRATIAATDAAGNAAPARSLSFTVVAK